MTVRVMMQQQTEIFTVDDFKTEYTFKDISGDTLKIKYKWNDKKDTLISSFNNLTKKQKGTDKKYLYNDPNIGTCIIAEITNEKGTTMKQIWKKSNYNTY